MATISSYSDAIINVGKICDAANMLPEPARRLLAAALRERDPRYRWTLDARGLLSCRHDAEPVQVHPMPYVDDDEE